MLERLQIDDSRFFVQRPHECTFGALLMAATFGALHCVCTIVDTNPELVRTRESGAEILHCVSPCHLFSGQILRFLLSRGARVDALFETSTSAPRTALDLACEQFAVESREKQRADLKNHIFILIDHGARVLPDLHPPWVIAHHGARQHALRLRAQAAACMLVSTVRSKYGLPRDVARLLARIVWRADWREWRAARARLGRSLTYGGE